MKLKLILAGTILSMSQMTCATRDLYSTNVPKDAFPTRGYKEMMERIEREENERKEKGYLEAESGPYEILSNIENRIKYNLFIKSHLKNSISKLKVATSLKHVPDSLKEKTFGYEEAGSFNQNTGWNGVTEIFKSKTQDICQFTHEDLQLSGGGYSLSEENERTDVNSKHTNVQVTGKKNQGFDYEINWFDGFNHYTITCVNKKFSNELTQRYIELAKQIDSNLQ